MPRIGQISVPNGDNTDVMQDLQRRFFGSLTNGAAFREGTALSAIPAWSAGVVVRAGYVCSNAGGLYYVMDTLSGGTTMLPAGVTTVTAPTGTGSAVIKTATDNLQYLYLGPATSDLVSADQSDTPVFTIAAMPGGNTRRYNPEVAADRAAMWITGSTWETAFGAGGGINGIRAVSNPNSFAFDIMTDAPVLGMWAVQNGGGQYCSPTINGRPLFCKTGIGYPWVASSNNSNFGQVLDWSAKPREVRRVRVPVGNQTFTGFWVDPKYSIWAPTNPNRYRLYVEGDSLTQLGQPGNGQYNAAHRLANLLGCDDVWDSSAGGTGFINSGGGSTLITRIPKVIAAAPDLLYVRPINNDVGNAGLFTSASRIAAYKQYFSTLLAALPNLVIICGGGFASKAANVTTDAASAWQVDLDMATAIAQFASPQVKFLATVTDPSGRWLLGDGDVSTTANTNHGNSDFMIGDGFDNLHANVRYYDVMMQREVNGLIDLMSEALT